MMSHIDKIIAKGHYAGLARQASKRRPGETPDSQRLRALAMKIRILRDEAEDTPGAAVAWGYLSDAMDAAMTKAILEEGGE